MSTKKPALEFKLDIQVAIASEYRDGSEICTLCLEKIEDMVAYEIAVTKPRVYKIMFHNLCYQHMFMAMLMLADKHIKETEERNRDATKFQS